MRLDPDVDEADHGAMPGTYRHLRIVSDSTILLVPRASSRSLGTTVLALALAR